MVTQQSKPNKSIINKHKAKRHRNTKNRQQRTGNREQHQSYRLGMVSNALILKLILKLHPYRIRNATLRWIQTFLSYRRQKVVIEGEESDSVPVTSGDPQGSVLGPILFQADINNLPQDIVSHVRLFTDDTAISLPPRKPGTTVTNYRGT